MYALGIYLDGSLLKISLARREKDHIHIELVRSFDLKGIDPLSNLKPILETKKTLIVTGLDAWEILLREVQVNLKRKREILSVLPFQSEGQIPYPLETAILIPFFNNQEKDASEITLLATKKEYLQEHLDKMATYNIDPDRVSSIPTALWRYAKSYLPNEISSVFHFGMEKSSYLYFEKEKLLFSQTINFGLQQFLNALYEDTQEENLESIDFSSLDPEEFPCLTEALRKFKKEWERIQAFFEKKGFSTTFSFLGNLPLSLRLFLENGSKNEKGDHPSYAIPIGLALDAIYQDKHSVQLRQNVYATPRQFKKRMKTLVCCLGLFSLLTFATWGSCHFFLKSKETYLIEKAEEYQGKKIDRNRDALVLSLRQWSKSLVGQKIPFPYQLTVPQVSDLLAWISTHPQLLKPGIEIKRIRYSLTKYPILGKSNVPYQAKVELEFSTTSPTFAREFHDSLLKGEGLVSTKHEISWNTHENKYSTSFILKGQN